jgi:hypothetical protein
LISFIALEILVALEELAARQEQVRVAAGV